jgi:hypothetical protein
MRSLSGTGLQDRTYVFLCLWADQIVVLIMAEASMSLWTGYVRLNMLYVQYVIWNTNIPADRTAWILAR